MALIQPLVTIVLMIGLLGLPAAALVVYLFRTGRPVPAILPALWLGAVIHLAIGSFFTGVLGVAPPFSSYTVQSSGATTTFSGAEVGALVYGATGFVALKAVSLRASAGSVSDVLSRVEPGAVVQALVVLAAVFVAATSNSAVVQAVALGLVVLFLAIRFSVVDSVARDLGLHKLGAMFAGPGPGLYSYTCENCDHTIVDWMQDPAFEDVLACPECKQPLEDQSAARTLAHEYYEEMEREERNDGGLL
jgi:hypothetical protein